MSRARLDGKPARRRYVPVIDLVALLLMADLAGAATGLAGPGRRAPGLRRTDVS
jgi:hypothetical protein